MEFMDFNNPFEPKAFHTFEYVQVHVMNMIIKAAVIAVCVIAALSYKMSFTISILVIPLYMILVRPHYSDDLLKGRSILYRIPFAEKRVIRKLLQDYLNKQKLTDTEYEVLDEHPELLAEYFHIQFLLNECLTVYLNPFDFLFHAFGHQIYTV